MSICGNIVDFDGHKLDVQELVSQPFQEHMKLIDKFAEECGVKPTDTGLPNAVRFVNLIKPLYWRLRREREKRIDHHEGPNRDPK